MNKALGVVLTNRPLQIFIIAAALLGFVYWYGRRSISDTMKYDHPLPNSGQGIPANWDATAKNWADRVFQVIDGVFTATATKEAVYASLNGFTDDQLTAVYNVYNQQYCRDNNQTMTRDIDGEWGSSLAPQSKQLLATLKRLDLR